MKQEDRRWLLAVALSLERADRVVLGLRPHIEGNVVVQLSDELAKDVTERLRRIANETA